MDETLPYGVGAEQRNAMARVKNREEVDGKLLASKLNFPYEMNEMRDNRNMYGSCICIG